MSFSMFLFSSEEMYNTKERSIGICDAAGLCMYGQRKLELLGKRDPNPYWFNIESYAVITSNALKIQQVFSAVFSLYR